jgi:hypothetical protein
VERWNDQQIANEMAVSSCNDKLAFLDSQEAKRLANRRASFAYQEMVNATPGNRARLSKNLKSWQCIGHPMEKTRRFRSHKDR